MRAEPKTSSQVLYFIQEIKKEKQVLDLCRDMGIMNRKLKEEDAGRSVGVLAGVFPPELAPKTAKQVPKGYRMPELLVFCGLEDGLLDRFLAEYRRRGIDPIGLKAVATPHNLFWTVCELTEELEQERAAMQAMSQNREG